MQISNMTACDGAYMLAASAESASAQGREGRVLEPSCTDGGGTMARDERDYAPVARPSMRAPLPAPSDLTRAQTRHALERLSSEATEVDVVSVLTLFQKTAQEMRTAAREQRDVQMNAEMKSLLGAAEQMNKAATERFVGGLAQGVMQIVGGGLQVAGGAYSCRTSVKGADLTIRAGKLAGAVDIANRAGRQELQTWLSVASTQVRGEADRFSARGVKANAAGQGLGGISGGIGNAVNSGFQWAASNNDAERARLEALAKEHELARQQAGEVAQQMLDVIRDVKETLGAINQSRHETNGAITRNIS